MRERDERRFVAVAFAIYAATTLVVALHHEPWRDEADAWLLLRDGGVGTMFARSGYLGMPALWYLLVAPLVKLGLPYASMTILNVVIAWGAALLFLIAAPFPRWARVLVVFSYPLAYEYAVIARPYALLTLLLFAAVASWRKPMRFAIAIALLANTTPHGLMLAAILGALSLTWNRSKAAIALMVVAGVLSVMQLWPPTRRRSTTSSAARVMTWCRARLRGRSFPAFRSRSAPWEACSCWPRSRTRSGAIALPRSFSGPRRWSCWRSSRSSGSAGSGMRR